MNTLKGDPHGGSNGVFALVFQEVKIHNEEARSRLIASPSNNVGVAFALPSFLVTVVAH
jgi:hypothetical protein